jgi:hypothetical protein
MPSPEPQAEMFAASDIATRPDTVTINARCVLRRHGDRCVVLVAGMPMAHWAGGDRMAEGHAIVMLVEQGWADQKQVAGAFGCSTRTVRRSQRRFEQGCWRSPRSAEFWT